MTWDDAVHWSLWIALAINAGCAVYNLRGSIRIRRTSREADAHLGWIISEVQRLAVLDHLLMTICCEAFGRDTGPVWQAWAQTMGIIRLNIAGTFRGRAWAAELFPGGPESIRDPLGEDSDNDGEFDRNTGGG